MINKIYSEKQYDNVKLEKSLLRQKYKLSAGKIN